MIYSEDELASILSNNLYMLREHYNLSQLQVAVRASHTCTRSYQYFELGKKIPHLNTIITISSFYEISLDMLLGRIPLVFPASPTLKPTLELSGEEVRRRLAPNLKHHRQRMNLTREQVADFLGLDIEPYKNLERGYRRPTCLSLIQLADLLQVSTDCLLAKRKILILR